MAFYPDVKPGDPFKPSARLSNQVRHFFNGVSTISAGKSKKSAYANNNRLEVVNPTKQLIPAYSAVAVGGITIINPGTPREEVIIGCRIATDDSGTWGITENDIAPDGGNGVIILSGLARAFIVAGGGSYVIPNADGKLIASDKGKNRILYRGTENTPGWVMMNSNKTSGEYTGTFKLRWIKDRQFELYYGAYPEITSNANSTRAGNTDLPGAEKVPRQFVYLPEGVKDAEVLLCACCNDGVYSTFVLVRDNDIHPDSIPVPAGYFASVTIGDIRENGDIYQSFTASGTIYFGKDWFL